MHTIRPDEITPAQKALVELHQAEVRDITPESRLERILVPADLTPDPSGLGYRVRRPKSVSGVYWVVVPSDSHIGHWWELRVSWHDGYVQAGHSGHGCPASEAGKRCWHGFGAAFKVAELHYGGAIPVGAAPLHASADPRPKPRPKPEDGPPFPVDKAFYA
jgi:hypothetical protein